MMQAVVLGQRQKSYVASPVGTGPQIASTQSSVGQNAGGAHPALITLSWGVLFTGAALAVLYFKVLA